MAKVSIASVNGMPIEIAEGESAERFGASVKSFSVFGGDRQPIHTRLLHLAKGQSAAWENSPMGHVAYIWNGAARAGEVELDQGSVVVVEHGASSQLTSASDDCQVLVFNRAPQSHSTIPGAGGHVHILPSRQVPRTSDMGVGAPVGAALFADASCGTCELWLHENSFTPNFDVRLHYHSEDEVLVVVGGEIILGARSYKRGTAISIAKGTFYGFRTGAEGLKFINFRPALPTIGFHRGDTPMDERKAYQKVLASPHYVDGPAASHNQ